MKSLVIGILLMGIVWPVLAGDYAEHKKIGDASFRYFTVQNQLWVFFKDTLGLGQFGVDYKVPFTCNKQIAENYKGLFAISDSVHQYTYGDLCALSGDHTVDPIQLFQGLFTKDYYINPAKSMKFKHLAPQLQKVMVMQDIAMEKYLNESKKSSWGYILLANDNSSHFQRPPLSIYQMLKSTDPSLFDLIVQFNLHKNDNNSFYLVYLRKRLALKFLHLNNTSKYAVMHLIALDYMNNAAIAFCEGDPEAMRKNFQFALIFNAFGDHFLQDAFSAGHIPVKRSWRGLDDLGVHNYYSRLGLDVTNLMGYQWHTYGDNYYDSTTFAMATLANNQSLNELWYSFNNTRTAFSTALKEDNGAASPVSLLKQINNKKVLTTNYADTILKHFNAYNYIPTPLSKQKYKEDIVLKHGSKVGAFMQLGINKAFGNAQQSLGWEAAYGVGFDISRYDVNNVKQYENYLKHRETLHWMGVSLAYSSNSFYNEVVHQWGINTQYILHDHYSFNIMEGLRSANTNTFLFSMGMGYEYKSLKCPVAPSFHLYYDICKGQAPLLGLKISLRLY